MDNGSSNDSVVRIRTRHPEITLLESRENLGFAGGNNLGFRFAMEHGTDYLWLLNNDTLPAPDALSFLVAKALSNTRIGAVASVCYYAGSPNAVQVWAGARVNLWSGYARNTREPHPDDWFDALYGASMLISRIALEDVGLLDEGFFFYLEETELCLRLCKKGWLLAAASESRILHKVSASTGGHKPVLERYFTTSGLRILSLHSPVPCVAMFLFVAIRVCRRLCQLQPTRSKSVWEGMLDYRKTLPVRQKIR